MKNALFVLFSGLIFSASAQQTINGTIEHGGLTREYILYVPASYSQGNEAPLVMNFHGYTSNASQQIFYGDFRPIADTAGFLLLCPNGTPDNQGINHWNVGWGGSTVDDVSFVSALLDSLSANYSINQNRIYSTGMSNGGFFSYKLACEMSDRITAIASVTGSMVNATMSSCSPNHPMPAMQIHGTNDPTVPYNGNPTMAMAPIEDVVNHWVSFNNCADIPVSLDLPNTSTTDGSTVTHFVYSGGTNNSTVEFYKVIDGGHTWPGSSINLPSTNQDFSASKEIWRFFSRYSLGDLVSLEEGSINQFEIYPNPSSDEIKLVGIDADFDKIQILSTDGRLIDEFPFSSEINVSELNEGTYFIQLVGATTSSVKFIKQ